MTAPDRFTGERFLPGVTGEIAYEHCHRYAFARRFAKGRRVLDAACGEGYGAALLGEVAQCVIGVDIDAAVVAEAATTYRTQSNLSFAAASVARLPIADATVDVIVSFETVEHLEADDQPRMLDEFARVLAPGGILVLSSPNRPEYSDARDYANPFHLSELDRDGLSSLLDRRFPAQQWYRQRRYVGSAIWSETPGERLEALSGSAASVCTAGMPPAMYFIVVGAGARESLPAPEPALSLYADRDDSERKRIDHDAREVLRLDGLLIERGRDVEELRAMVAYRDAIIARQQQVERESEEARAALARESDQRRRQIDAQERIIAYRQSARWWLVLPFLRVRRLWNRIRAA